MTFILISFYFILSKVFLGIHHLRLLFFILLLVTYRHYFFYFHVHLILKAAVGAIFYSTLLSC